MKTVCSECARDLTNATHGERTYKICFDCINKMIPSASISPLEVIVVSTPKVCECGSDKIGHPGHSTWCQKYEV